MEVYEREGAAYAARRGIQRPERTRAFGSAVTGLRLDLGCGPGHHLDLLGRPAIALDAAASMVRAAATHAPAVQADLARLPFGDRSFDGIWASKAHQHLRAAELPMALAEAHRVLRTGGRIDLTVFPTSDRGAPAREEVTTSGSGDDLPGRRFTWWDPGHLSTVVEAAGFSIERTEVGRWIDVTATAARALPDHVGADMRLLCCGLNPSLHAADAGVGYVTGSNRFWRAMARAGLSTRDRDPRHLLHVDRIGMTDLVKRATARADEVATAEFRTGLARLDALCAWLRPAAVAMVGLQGWRAAVDRRATVGWQDRDLGGRPVYVLPSTSGLNAGTSLDELADHLRRAASPAT
ncbi:MAG: methyltransferase domain-containing protein [Acidimicrobiales bacterium]|nr:methyltransferase domain-containing protein [Acidimicrobiales bacterium]HRW38822.1 methyltransferase domain-containing protein [Aquihabitans sp.]